MSNLGSHDLMGEVNMDMVIDNSCVCVDFTLNEITGEYYCKTCNKLENYTCNNQCNDSNSEKPLECTIL